MQLGQRSNLRFRFDVLQPLTLERIIGRDPLFRVQCEHFVEKIQRRVGHVRELFSQSSPILFLLQQGAEVRQLYDAWPDGRRGRATQARNDFKLKGLGAALEQRLLCKKFAEDAADTPNVN